MRQETITRVIGTLEEARERGWEVERRVYTARIAHLRERLDEAVEQRDRARSLACEYFEILAEAESVGTGPR